MPWVRVDDSFYDHPGHAGNDLAAWGLWVWSLAWSNRNMTDGEIPAAVVQRMDPDGSASGALLASGRFRRDGEVIVVHDYLEYQPSAATIREKRERERARWQRRGERKPTPDGANDDSEPTPPGVDAESEDPPRVPQTQDVVPNGTTRRAQRGTKLPDEYPITEQHREWHAANTPGIDLELHHTKFVNHWQSTTKNAVKTNWFKAWQNWMLTEWDRIPPALRSKLTVEPSSLDLPASSNGAWVCAVGNPHCHNGNVHDPDAPIGTPVPRCECVTIREAVR